MEHIESDRTKKVTDHSKRLLLRWGYGKSILKLARPTLAWLKVLCPSVVTKPIIGKIRSSNRRTHKKHLVYTNATTGTPLHRTKITCKANNATADSVNASAMDRTLLPYIQGSGLDSLIVHFDDPSPGQDYIHRQGHAKTCGPTGSNRTPESTPNSTWKMPKFREFYPNRFSHFFAFPVLRAFSTSIVKTAIYNGRR